MKDATITVRLPQDMKDALSAAALQEDRTMSKVVERILREALAPKKKGRGQ